MSKGGDSGSSASAQTPSQWASALSNASISAWKEADILSFSVAQLQALSPGQISNISVPWAVPMAVWTAETLNAVPLQYWSQWGTRYLSTTSNGVTSITPLSQSSNGAVSGKNNWFDDVGRGAAGFAFTPSVVAGISNDRIAQIGGGLGRNQAHAPSLATNAGYVSPSDFTAALSAATASGANVVTWNISASQTAYMFASGWADMGADFMGALTYSQLGAIAHPESALGAAQFGYLSANQLMALGQMDWSKVTSAQLNATKISAFRGLQNNVLRALSTQAWTGLDQAHTAVLNAADVQLLPATTVARMNYFGYALTASVGAVLTAAQVASIPSTCWAQISDSQFLNSLSTAALQAIPVSAFASMVDAVVGSLDHVHVAALTANQAQNYPLSKLSDASSAFYQNPNTLNFATFVSQSNVNWALAPASFIKLLTPAQLRLISPSQMAALTPTALSALTRAQTQVLSLAQVQALSASQLSAMAYISRRTDVVQEVFGASQLVQLSLSFWSNVDSNFLNALAVSAFQAITTTQLQAISAGAFANLDQAHVNALTGMQLLALSAEQVGQFSGAYLSIAFLRGVRLTAFKGLVPEQMHRLHDYLFNTVANNAFATTDPTLLQNAENQFASLLASILDSDDGREAWLQQSVNLLIQLHWLDATAAANLSVSDVSVTYSSLNWSWMSGTFLNSISTAVFAQIRASSVAQFNLTALAELNDTHLQALTVTQAAGLSGAQLSSISNLGALSAAVVQSLSATQLAGIHQDWSQISANFLNNMTARQFMGLPPAQFGQLTAAQLATTAIDWRLISPEQLNALSLSEFGKLCAGANPAILHTTVGVLLGLGGEQLAILAQAATEYSAVQMNTLLNRLFGAFSNEQTSRLIALMQNDTADQIVLQSGLVALLAKMDGSTDGIDVAIQTLVSLRQMQPTWFSAANLSAVLPVLSERYNDYNHQFYHGVVVPQTLFNYVFNSGIAISLRQSQLDPVLQQVHAVQSRLSNMNFLQEVPNLPLQPGALAPDLVTMMNFVTGKIDNLQKLSPLLRDLFAQPERTNRPGTFQDAVRANVVMAVTDRIAAIPANTSAAERFQIIGETMQQRFTTQIRTLLERVVTSELGASVNHVERVTKLNQNTLSVLSLGNLLIMLGAGIGELGTAIEASLNNKLSKRERDNIIASASLNAIASVAQGLQVGVYAVLQAVMRRYAGGAPSDIPASDNLPAEVELRVVQVFHEQLAVEVTRNVLARAASPVDLQAHEVVPPVSVIEVINQPGPVASPNTPSASPPGSPASSRAPSPGRQVLDMSAPAEGSVVIARSPSPADVQSLAPAAQFQAPLDGARAQATAVENAQQAGGSWKKITALNGVEVLPYAVFTQTKEGNPATFTAPNDKKPHLLNVGANGIAVVVINDDVEKSFTAQFTQWNAEDAAWGVHDSLSGQPIQLQRADMQEIVTRATDAGRPIQTIITYSVSGQLPLDKNLQIANILDKAQAGQADIASGRFVLDNLDRFVYRVWSDAIQKLPDIFEGNELDDPATRQVLLDILGDEPASERAILDTFARLEAAANNLADQVADFSLRQVEKYPLFKIFDELEDLRLENPNNKVIAKKYSAALEKLKNDPYFQELSKTADRAAEAARRIHVTSGALEDIEAEVNAWELKALTKIRNEGTQEVNLSDDALLQQMATHLKTLFGLEAQDVLGATIFLRLQNALNKISSTGHANFMLDDAVLTNVLNGGDPLNTQEFLDSVQRQLRSVGSTLALDEATVSDARARVGQTQLIEFLKSGPLAHLGEQMFEKPLFNLQDMNALIEKTFSDYGISVLTAQVQQAKKGIVVDALLDYGNRMNQRDASGVTGLVMTYHKAGEDLLATDLVLRRYLMTQAESIDWQSVAGQMPEAPYTETEMMDGKMVSDVLDSVLKVFRTELGTLPHKNRTEPTALARMLVPEILNGSLSRQNAIEAIQVFSREFAAPPHGDGSFLNAVDTELTPLGRIIMEGALRGALGRQLDVAAAHFLETPAMRLLLDPTTPIGNVLAVDRDSPMIRGFSEQLGMFNIKIQSWADAWANAIVGNNQADDRLRLTMQNYLQADGSYHQRQVLNTRLLEQVVTAWAYAAIQQQDKATLMAEGQPLINGYIELCIQSIITLTGESAFLPSASTRLTNNKETVLKLDENTTFEYERWRPLYENIVNNLKQLGVDPSYFVNVWVSDAPPTSVTLRDNTQPARARTMSGDPPAPEILGIHSNARDGAARDISPGERPVSHVPHLQPILEDEVFVPIPESGLAHSLADVLANEVLMRVTDSSIKSLVDETKALIQRWSKGQATEPVKRWITEHELALDERKVLNVKIDLSADILARALESQILKKPAFWDGPTDNIATEVSAVLTEGGYRPNTVDKVLVSYLKKIAPPPPDTRATDLFGQGALLNLTGNTNNNNNVEDERFNAELTTFLADLIVRRASQMRSQDFTNDLVAATAGIVEDIKNGAHFILSVEWQARNLNALIRDSGLELVDGGLNRNIDIDANALAQAITEQLRTQAQRQNSASPDVNAASLENIIKRLILNNPADQQGIAKGLARYVKNMPANPEPPVQADEHPALPQPEPPPLVVDARPQNTTPQATLRETGIARAQIHWDALKMAAMNYGMLGFALFSSVLGIAAGLAGIIYAAQSTTLSWQAKAMVLAMNGVRVLTSGVMLVASGAQIASSVVKGVQAAADTASIANAGFAIGNVIGITTNIAQIGIQADTLASATDSTSRLIAGLSILDSTLQLILNTVGTIALAFGPVGMAINLVTFIISALLPSTAAIATAVEYRKSYNDLTGQGLYKEAEVMYMHWQVAAMDASPIVNWTSSIYTEEMKKSQERKMDHAWMDKSAEERLLYSLRVNTALKDNFDSLRAQMYAGAVALTQPLGNLSQTLTRATMLMLSQDNLSYFEGDKLATVKLAGTLNYATNSVSRAPKLIGANVNGQVLSLVFNQDLASLSSQLPNLSSFSVLVNGAAVTISGLSVLNNVVTLSLATAVKAGQSVTFSYSDPTAGNDSKAVQNVLGVDLSSIVNYSVVNGLDSDKRAPKLADAVAQDNFLTLVFDEALSTAADKVPEKGAFSVLVNGSAVHIYNLGVHDQRVLLSLDDPIAVGATVTVSYNANYGDGALQDAAGNLVASLNAQSVENTGATSSVTASRVGWLQYDNFVASVQGTGTEAASVLNGDDYTVYANADDATSGTSRLRYLSLSNAAGEFDMLSVTRAVENNDRIWLDASNAQGVNNFAINTHDMMVWGGQGKNSYSLARPYAAQSYIVAANAWSASNNVISISGSASDTSATVNLDYFLTADNISAGLPVTQNAFTVLGANDGLDVVVGSGDNQSYMATSNVANINLTGANANVSVGESAQVSVGVNGRVLVDMDMWRGLNATAPVLSSTSAVNGVIKGNYGSYSLLNFAPTDSLNANFNGKLNLSYQIGHLPTLDAFSVYVGSTLVGVNSLSVNGKRLTLNLSSAVAQNEVVSVSYADASNADDDNTLQGLTGKDVGSFSKQAVVNTTADTTAPTLAVATVQGNSLIVHFSEALQQSYQPLNSAWSVYVNGTRVAVTRVAFNDSSSLRLTLASAVNAGQTVNLNYSAASDTSLAVQDLAGNITSSFSSASVINLANVAQAPNLRTVTANGNVLTLTFDGTVRYTLSNPSAFVVTANNTPLNISGVSVAGNSVLLSLTSAVSSGQLVEVSYSPPQQLSDATTLRDWLGNVVGSISAQVANNITGQDLTPPSLQYAIVNGTSLVLTFSETLNSQAGFTPLPSGFTVNINGTAVNVTQALVSGATVTLSLASAANYGDTMTLSYTDLSTGNDAAVVQDLAGNDAVSFENINVINNTPDTTPPTLLSATVKDNQLSLLFSESLNASSGYLPALTSMAVTVNGVAVSINAGNVIGDTATLTLGTAVNAGDYVNFNYTAPSGNTLQAFQDGAGNDLLSIANFNVTNLTGLDLTPPSLVSAQVNGSVLTLTFSEALASTASFTPGASAFTVSVDGNSATVSGVRLNGTQAVLTLASAVDSTSKVIVGYARPSTQAIQDGAQNMAASFSAQSVSNVTADTTPPSLSSASVAGAVLTLTFSENLATTPALLASASEFAVTVDGQAVDVLSAVSSGNSVSITLSKAVAASQKVSVDYTASTSGINYLQDVANNKTANFSRTVTNSSGLASIQNATVNGTTLSMIFNQELDANSTHLPPLSAFAVKVNGVSSAVSSLAVSGHVVTLTLGAAVTAGQKVTVNYTSTDNDTAALQNRGGMDVQSFSAPYAVHNLSVAPEAATPSLSNAKVNGSTLTLTFSEALDAGVGEWWVNYLPDGQYDASGHPLVTSRVKASGFVNVLGSNNNDSFIIGDQSGLESARQLGYVQLGNGQGVQVNYYDTSGNLFLALGNKGQANVILESGSSLQKLLTAKLVQSDADIAHYKANRDTVTLKSLSSLTAFLSGYETIDATDSTSSLTAEIGEGDHQIKLGGQTVHLQFDKVVSNTSISTRQIPNSWLDYQYFNFDGINADGLWVGRESDGTVLFKAQWKDSASGDTDNKLNVSYDGTLSNVVFEVGNVVSGSKTSQLRLDKLIEAMSAPAFSTDANAASHAMTDTDTATKLYRITDIVAYSAASHPTVTGGV